MIRLRQIRRADLAPCWPRIRQAVEEVLAWSKGYSPGWVLAAAERGDLFLLEVFANEPFGLILAQIDSHSTERVLYLFGVWAGPEAPEAWMDELSPLLGDLSRRLGCMVIRAKSPRRGWERLAARLGFSPVAVEYERRIS